MQLTESEFLDIYHRHKESGLNVKDFCSNEGLKESTYYYWRKKLVEKGRIKDFIPLVVKSPAPIFKSANGSGFANPTNGNSGGDNYQMIEIVYPNGNKLRIPVDTDPDYLHSLLTLNV